ncbi:hypothetical protein [Sphingomonas qomolangmaensis]|uniref:TonB C-terminal domain-containing protein n=1 Tax=Sphingomonas qomolangmaensis TaxID=2918765 RepID=A0ABY5L995_9SPHN|nr:hypothetical protein [Sphingomonas qomolangmaensis]UUL83017.1 hypothetical protein NMP03_01935 [Sphingomonas qomolangmaensis]
MLWALLLAQAIPPALPLPSRPGQTIAWEELPALSYREPPTISPQITAFVVGEVKAGRCKPNLFGATRQAMQVDIAVLVTPEFGARVTIPRAIDCPTVEQYAAGLVLGFARNNLPARVTAAPRWYRATMTFEWPI